MELLQSQAPAQRELLGNSTVRTLENRFWILDIRIKTLDIRVWTLDIRGWTLEQPVVTMYQSIMLICQNIRIIVTQTKHQLNQLYVYFRVRLTKYNNMNL